MTQKVKGDMEMNSVEIREQKRFNRGHTVTVYAGGRVTVTDDSGDTGVVDTKRAIKMNDDGTCDIPVDEKHWTPAPSTEGHWIAYRCGMGREGGTYDKGMYWVEIAHWEPFQKKSRVECFAVVASSPEEAERTVRSEERMAEGETVVVEKIGSTVHVRTMRR